MKQFSEAVKIKDGQIYQLDYHQRRVDKTVSHFSGKPVDLSVVREHLPEYARKGLFKCRITYGEHIDSIEYLPYSFRKIETVRLMVDDAIDYSYKYADRSRLNRLLEDSGCDDILIVRRGRLTDASSSNLVFVSADGLFTPDSCLLPGSKRQFLLDNKRICETTIRIDDIDRYERVLFINAMTDLEDNIGIDTAAIIRNERAQALETL